MNNKSRKLNVIPATAIAAAGTLTSQVEKATWESGIRFYITVASPTGGTGTDTIFLCAVPPHGGNPIPLIGIAVVGAFSLAAGTYIADFYPSAWLPLTVAANGALIGAAGVWLPMQWAVRIVMGTGNAATITVDAETLP